MWNLCGWTQSNVCEDDHTKISKLTEIAENFKPGETGLLALDWNNGNRTILVDPKLTGLMIGLTLHTTQPEMYRTLIEGTAFSAKKILDRIEEYGIHVEEIINCGGIAEKNWVFT